MASVEKNDIRLESAFMSTFWNFIKHFWIPEEDDEYWDELVSKADELIKGMEKKSEDENTPVDIDFCQALMLAFVNYEESKWKKQQKKERNQS